MDIWYAIRSRGVPIFVEPRRQNVSPSLGKGGFKEAFLCRITAASSDRNKEITVAPGGKTTTTHLG